MFVVWLVPQGVYTDWRFYSGLLCICWDSKQKHFTSALFQILSNTTRIGKSTTTINFQLKVPLHCRAICWQPPLSITAQPVGLGSENQLLPNLTMSYCQFPADADANSWQDVVMSPNTETTLAFRDNGCLSHASNNCPEFLYPGANLVSRVLGNALDKY